MKIVVSNITCQTIISGADMQVCDVHKILREYLRIRPNNWGMVLKQMARRGIRWDGYTYFYTERGTFATGFLPLVVRYLIDLSCKVVLEDRRENMSQWCSNADLHFTGPLGELAGHQKTAIQTTLSNIVQSAQLLAFPRGIWDMATNSRKTATAGCLIQNIDNPKVIMLVAEQGLLKQHYEYYKTVFTGNDEVGIVTSSSMQFGSILTICMVRTLYNRIKKSATLQRDLQNRFNILVVDECHDHASKQSVYVINKINAGVRVGMGGTPLQSSDKIARFRLIGMFGPILATTSKRELQDKGFSLTPNIIIKKNPTLPANALTYEAEMIEVVTASEELAELIADIVCKHRKQKVLIPFFNHAHGKLMYDTFCERYPSLAHLADWVHGTHPDRADRIANYIANKTRYLFGSTILQQGINISDVEVGINAIADKSAITLSQFMGRLERLDNVSTHFTWYDFFHNGKYCGKHSKERIKLYKKENYSTPIVFDYPNRRGIPI